MVNFKLGDNLVNFKLGDNLVNGQAHNESLVAQLVRAPNRYLGDHGFDSRQGLRIFLCPMLVSLLKKDHLHYLSPSLKFTIFIIYYKLDDFDIADPSSTQDACHIST